LARLALQSVRHSPQLLPPLVPPQLQLVLKA
jgi:hypothetical protein